MPKLYIRSPNFKTLRSTIILVDDDGEIIEENMVGADCIGQDTVTITKEVTYEDIETVIVGENDAMPNEPNRKLIVEIKVYEQPNKGVNWNAGMVYEFTKDNLAPSYRHELFDVKDMLDAWADKLNEQYEDENG